MIPYMIRPTQTDIACRIIEQWMAEYIKPFSTGEVCIEVSSNPFDDRYVKVYSSSFPDHVATISRKDLAEAAALSNAYDVADLIGNKAGQYFSSVYIHPEPNIILGED